MDLAHLLFRSAQRHPDRPLWVATHRETVTYAQGAARVAALANAILKRTEQRSRVVILTTNRYEGMESYFGVIAAGCGAVTLNPRGHTDDHRHAITDSGASIVIVDIDLADRIAYLRGTLPTVEHWVAFGGRVEGYEAWEDWISAEEPTRPDILIDPDDPAWVFYTSGTTGKPKGAIETHRNLLAMTQHFLVELGPDLAATDVILHLAPISHGSTSVGLPHIAVGAAHAFPENLSFDPAAVFSTIEKLGVTATMLAPTMIRMLLDAPDAGDFDLSSLKSVVYGAAPMPLKDLEEALRVFGPVFIQFYGQAEAAATITCLPKAAHRIDGDPAALKRLRSAGRETMATRIRIMDPEGNALPAGQTGEICVRGELVMGGYWNRPDATAETIRDGWLHTGDAGYLDEEGYLFITDRIKDMIISGGSNIYAKEVEDVLGKLDGVHEIAIIGVPDATWGEVVAAVIVPVPGADLTAEKVIDFARANMASYKKPRHVWFTDALPTSAYGKILKRRLRDTYAAAIDTATMATKK
ncbi:class I adenylate-forming enzyme family protein [Streptomyces sp. NPDC013157]|uniref:class I adenylate-forming enzyme family protein n=1 Tax=Streptomyces sp. NPDC013157 TaxID=3364861 RepID=UPI003695C1F4